MGCGNPSVLQPAPAARLASGQPAHSPSQPFRPPALHYTPAQATPSFGLYSTAEGGAAYVARDLLDISSHIFKPEVGGLRVVCSGMSFAALCGGIGWKLLPRLPACSWLRAAAGWLPRQPGPPASTRHSPPLLLCLHPPPAGAAPPAGVPGGQPASGRSACSGSRCGADSGGGA